MFKPISEMLGGAAGRLRVRKPLEARAICVAVDIALGDLWDQAAPMRAVTYQDGVVTVAVMSSAWASELTMRGDRIRHKAHQRLGGSAISRVKTKVSPRLAQGDAGDSPPPSDD